MGVAEIDGLRIHYHAPRDPARAQGQRILYVHGTGCNGRVWEDHMAAIAESAYAGRDRPPGPRPVRRPRLPRDGGLRARGHGAGLMLGWDRFAVAGHSLGGGVAITAALYHPERLTGIILVDTGARLRVNPELLRASRAAAAAGRARPTDRAWGFAASTPQRVVDALEALTADTDRA